MGVNLGEILEYRQTIMRLLGSNQRIKDLLTGEHNSTASIHDLINKHIFPYQYVPGTTTDKRAYITMDISVRKVFDRTIKSLGITLFVFCEDSFNLYVDPHTNKGCLRYDVLANEIDKILNGNTSIGFRVDLVFVKPYSPEDSHHGLVLQYETNDLNWKV